MCMLKCQKYPKLLLFTTKNDTKYLQRTRDELMCFIPNSSYVLFRCFYSKANQFRRMYVTRSHWLRCHREKKSMWWKNESAKPTQSWQLLSNVLFSFCLVHDFHISSVSLRFVCVFLAIENICLVHACIFLGHISSCIHICMRFSFSTPLHNWNTTTLEYIQTSPSCF